MERDAVIAWRIDHEGKGTSLDTSFERREEFFLQLTFGDHWRCSVLTWFSGTVSKIVLDAGCYFFRGNMIRVFALVTTGKRHAHTALDNRIFAEAFPHSRPTLVTAQVQCRREYPRNIAGSGLVRSYNTHVIRQLIIERCGKTDFLREKHGSRSIWSSVNLVKAIETWDTHLVHRNILKLLYEGPVFSRCSGDTIHCIQNRTYLVLSYKFLTLFRHIVSSFLKYNFRGELGHLSNFFLKCHLGEQLFNFSFDFLVLRNGAGCLVLTWAKQCPYPQSG